MSFFQRRLACQWRERLAAHRQARISNIRFWNDRLPNGLTRLCRKYLDVSLIRLPLLARSHEERDQMVKLSEQEGLGVMPAYPTPIHEIPDIAGEFDGRQYPRAGDVCRRLFTIPVHELIYAVDKEQLLTLLLRMTVPKPDKGEIAAAASLLGTEDR